MPRTSHTCTSSTDPSPPRYLTITRVFDDGIELNWIPPREPNGDIRHYIIKYSTQDGTQQKMNTTNNTNYYNLTGLERGQTYNNITVVAVNSAGGGGESPPITSYVHNPTVESTSELELEVLNTLMAEIFTGCNFRESADLRLFCVFNFATPTSFANLTPTRPLMSR